MQYKLPAPVPERPFVYLCVWLRLFVTLVFTETFIVLACIVCTYLCNLMRGVYTYTVPVRCSYTSTKSAVDIVQRGVYNLFENLNLDQWYVDWCKRFLCTRRDYFLIYNYVNTNILFHTVILELRTFITYNVLFV